jgi:hypothetical protein
MGHVDGADLVSQAIATLYAGEPEGFIGQRKELAAAARAAGDRAAAKQIAALAKPTRSAWVVNTLVHADPGVAAQLTELGDKLRTGEATLDGAAIRQLSVTRRRLVEDLVRRALAQAGLGTPSATLREDVAGTFSAALADPAMAEQVAAGTLVTAVRWAGFSPDIGTATPVARPAAKPSADPVADPADEREREQREHERRRAISAAEQTVTRARKAADAAATKLGAAERTVRLLEGQLAEAGERLSHSRAQAQEADIALRHAQDDVARLQASSTRRTS